MHAYLRCWRPHYIKRGWKQFHIRRHGHILGLLLYEYRCRWLGRHRHWRDIRGLGNDSASDRNGRRYQYWLWLLRLYLLNSGLSLHVDVHRKRLRLDLVDALDKLLILLPQHLDVILDRRDDFLFTHARFGGRLRQMTGQLVQLALLYLSDVHADETLDGRVVRLHLHRQPLKAGLEICLQLLEVVIHMLQYLLELSDLQLLQPQTQIQSFLILLTLVEREERRRLILRRQRFVNLGSLAGRHQIVQRVRHAALCAQML